MTTDGLQTFTFRDVAARVGIPNDKHYHWALGHWLKRYFAKQGIEPQRLLTEKTNPNPSVAAPHCIAHYPMQYFDEVCKQAGDDWDYIQSQQGFDF